MVVGRAQNGGGLGAGDRHPVFASVDEMLAGATERSAEKKSSDSLSGSPFERVTIAEKSYLVKYVGQRVDWLARALDDRLCFVRQIWAYGLLAALPAELDHTIAAVADDVPNDRVALLLRDVGPGLVPPGSSTIPIAQHRRFVEHMAVLHAAFWGFEDVIGLLPPGRRYIALTPETTSREAAAGHDDPIPRMLAPGWAALRRLAPEAHDLALALSRDPTPLAVALEQTPATLVHGDWKAGNLGSHPDGRTILLDWGWPGRGGPLVDLAWYLAVNCDRLPESKEDTLDAYREALRHQGIDAGPWWHDQLGPALLGAFVQLGWSKTQDPIELDWWVRRVTPVARGLL
jgi:hypothetical protein